MMRYMVSCLTIAVVIALSSYGMAIAASGIAHQAHCMESADSTGSSTPTVAAHVHQHGHDKMASQHTMPKHEHETCMSHACPALSDTPVALSGLSDLLLTTLSWHEKPLQRFVHADALKRPPRT